MKPFEQQVFETQILKIVSKSSCFDSVDVYTGSPSSMEGIVSRNAADFAVKDMAHNVFKYVRKDHVKTDQHWSRNWKRASLNWEKS